MDLNVKITVLMDLIASWVIALTKLQKWTIANFSFYKRWTDQLRSSTLTTRPGPCWPHPPWTSNIPAAHSCQTERSWSLVQALDTSGKHIRVLQFKPQNQCDQIGRFIELWESFIVIWRFFSGHTAQNLHIKVASLSLKSSGKDPVNITLLNREFIGI